MCKRNFSLLLLLILVSLQANSQDTQYENLVFEGAGMRGLAYTGVITELEQQGVLENINKVGGTSAGSIVSLALSLGYTPEEITEIIYSTDFSKFNDAGFIFFSGIRRLKRNYGYYKGDKFVKWLEDIIDEKTCNPDITFQELHDAGFKDLYVVATSLNRQQNIVFSYETYPNMKIKHAIRASMSVPLYFQAVFVDKEGNVYTRNEATPEMDLMVDGGITGNFPIDIFDSTAIVMGREIRIANPKTIGIRIDSDQQIEYDRDSHELAPYDVQNVKDYMQAFYLYVVENLNRKTLTDEDWVRTISVSDAGIGPKIKRLSNDQKKALIESGKQGTRFFFDTNIAEASVD